MNNNNSNNNPLPVNSVLEVTKKQFQLIKDQFWSGGGGERVFGLRRHNYKGHNLQDKTAHMTDRSLNWMRDL